MQNMFKVINKDTKRMSLTEIGSRKALAHFSLTEKFPIVVTHILYKPASVKHQLISQTATKRRINNLL